MAEDQVRYQVRLSSDELSYLLRLLGIATLLPAAGNPLADLPAEQQAVALAVAERGLRARGLVQRNGADRPAVQTDLLETVGACAFPQRLLSVFQWTGGEDTPIAVYGYVREGTAVLHAQPDPVLHDLSVVVDEAALLDRVLELFAGSETGGEGADAFELAAATLAGLRAAARAGEATPVADRLAGLGVPTATAQRFAAALAAQPTVTMFASWQQMPGEVIDRREVTLLQGTGTSWLLTPCSDGAEVMVRPGARQAVRALLGPTV